MVKTIEVSNSPINWYGGKGGSQHRKLLLGILELINKSNTNKFVDVFGGSAIVSLNVINKAIAYNDKNVELVNFFEVMRESKMCEELKKNIYLTLYSIEEYENNKKQTLCDNDKVQRAVRFYVLVMQSRNATGAMKNESWKVSYSVIRNGAYQNVSSWLTNIDKNLPQCVEKIREFQIVNLDCFKCIEKFDDENTVFYLDPPYQKQYRTAKTVYKDEFSDEQHAKLIDSLKTIKGQVVLSGYVDVSKKKDELYDSLLNFEGWKRELFEKNTTTSMKKNAKENYLKKTLQHL